MQKQRVTQDQIWGNRRKSGTQNFFPLTSIVWSFEEKESSGSGLAADQHWTRIDCSQADQTSFDRDFPVCRKGHSSFRLGVCSGGSRPCLSMQPCSAASIGSTLRDEGYKISVRCLSPLRRLHGGGCQSKAKQIRCRNDDPVFPCCARSMGQICSCVCVYTRAPSRSCSATTATPTRRK